MAKIKEIFAKNLKEAIKKKGISEDSLAKSIGMKDRRTINHYTRGKGTPSVELVQKIAEKLEVNPAWLVGWGESGNDKPFSDRVDESLNHGIFT